MNASNEDLYALHWNNHTKVLKGIFNSFRNDNELVDVTLSCEGKKLKAHKIVLSACSLYFLELFRDNPCQHPIIILRDIKYQALVDILSFMYIGEVNVAMENLNMFLQTAEYLQVKGLSEEMNGTCEKQQKTFISESVIDNINKPVQIEILPINTTEIVHKNNQKNKNHTKTTSKNELQNVDDSFKQKSQSKSNREVTEDDLEERDGLKKEIIDVDDYNEDESVEYIEIDQTEIQQNEFNDHYLLGDLEGSTSASSQTKLYPCPRCNKVFNHQISLKLHLPRHSGRTSCHLCHAVLGRKYDLKVHLKRKHNIEMSVSRKRSHDSSITDLWIPHKNMTL